MGVVSIDHACRLVRRALLIGGATLGLAFLGVAGSQAADDAPDLLGTVLPNADLLEGPASGAAAPLHPEDAEPVQTIEEPISAVARPVSAVAQPVVDPIAPASAQVTDAAETLLEPVASVAEPVAAVAEPAIEAAQPVTATVAETVGQTAPVLDAVRPALEQAIDIVQPVKEAAAPPVPAEEPAGIVETVSLPEPPSTAHGDSETKTAAAPPATDREATTRFQTGPESAEVRTLANHDGDASIVGLLAALRGHVEPVNAAAMSSGVSNWAGHEGLLPLNQLGVPSLGPASALSGAGSGPAAGSAESAPAFELIPPTSTRLLHDDGWTLPSSLAQSPGSSPD